MNSMVSFRVAIGFAMRILHGFWRRVEHRMRSIKLTALQFIETNLTVCKGSSTSATLCDCLLGPSIIPLASLGQLQGVSLHIRIQKPLMDDNPKQNLWDSHQNIWTTEFCNTFHNYLLLARALRTRSFLSCTARCFASTSFLNMNIEETDARWRSHGDKTRGNLQLHWKLPVKVFPSFASLSPQHLLNVSGRKLENKSNFSCSYKISRDVPEV